MTQIDSNKGSLRYINPDKSHVVFIEDDVKTEVQISAILAAASALAQLKTTRERLPANINNNLTNCIYQMITVGTIS
jgi:cytidylate kinase